MTLVQRDLDGTERRENFREGLFPRKSEKLVWKNFSGRLPWLILFSHHIPCSDTEWANDCFPIPQSCPKSLKPQACTSSSTRVFAVDSVPAWCWQTLKGQHHQSLIAQNLACWIQCGARKLRTKAGRCLIHGEPPCTTGSGKWTSMHTSPLSHPVRPRLVKLICLLRYNVETEAVLT